MFSRAALKEILGEIPLTAELYWHLRQSGQPVDAHFSLERLQRHLPEWVAQARDAQPSGISGKRVAIFSTLRYWIEHTSLLGLTLAGLGHQVTLAFLPYDNWVRPINRFDLRRQNTYARTVLSQAQSLLEIVPLLDVRTTHRKLPSALRSAVDAVAYRDTQYSLQKEDIDPDSDLYHLRLDRDLEAARLALSWLEISRPEVVIVPNGSILEFGVIYAVARYLVLPLVTFEFGEQNHRIWLAQNSEVMMQDTHSLWKARQHDPLTEGQWEKVRELFSARQNATLWENFARRWQGVPSEGGRHIRDQLGLNSRPIAMLATNVIGDSLALDRQVFSQSMTEWLARTCRFFAGHPDFQFVIRIHPGELITKGPSVAEVVHETFPILPDNIHLIPADAQINTYDLVEIADLGLVYTTTVGMEMVMAGLPVIVAGQTHYRGKGFTHDPDSWEDYLELLMNALANPTQYRPTKEQVELAWQYAYRFFFEYPHPFPWHLVHYWSALKTWPVSRVLSAEGQAAFGDTFRYLVGDPIDWHQLPA